MLNIITPDEAITLDGLFYERTKKTPDQVAYIQYDKISATWQQTTWAEMASQVALWQAAIRAEALQTGDRVAILLKNSKEWVCFDQAALGLGLVVVPLYLDDRPDNIGYILDDANIKLLIIQEQRQWTRLKQAFNENKNSIQSLQRIIILDVHSANLELDDPRLITLTDWLPETSQILDKREGDKDDLATIVYTSGTTGKAKGVMLSHYNILSVSYSTATTLNIRSDDSLVSFLPLSHTLERTTGYYLPIMAGMRIYYSQSVQHLAQELILHKPTIIVAVPRIFEQIYNKIHEQLKTAPIHKRLLFQLTINIGWKNFLKQQQNQPQSSFSLNKLLWPVLKRLVADKVAQKFGGQLRIAASGGAAISFEVSKTFLALGINILQGYGLTETSPVVSFNRLNDNNPRSIGQAIDCVELKLGENDELLIKSPGVMMGYWNNHSATSAIIDAEDWLHSGDQAKIDHKTGHVFITGRIKDILVMSNGEKIPPADIENAIIMDEWFDQALLVGEGQAFLSAILVFNPQMWTIICEKSSLDPFNKENLHNKKIHSLVVSKLKKTLHNFPGYAKIRRVILTLEPWTIENELMTPTLKNKRNNIIALFKNDIDDIYRA